MKKGDIFYSKSGDVIEIVHYVNAKEVHCRNVTKGVEFKTQAGAIRSGTATGVGSSRQYSKITELPQNAKWVAEYEGWVAVTPDGKVWGQKGDSLVEYPTNLSGRRKDNIENLYKYVNLSRHGHQKMVSVHRLVAQAFIENPEGKPCVNHINGDKLDNRVENLEWCTFSENTVHAYTTGLLKTTTQITTEKFTSGMYDEIILESVRMGYLVDGISKTIAAQCPEETLERLGVKEVFLLLKPSGKNNDRRFLFSVQDLKEMRKTMSLKAIAAITGYSESAISRRVNGSRN